MKILIVKTVSSWNDGITSVIEKIIQWISSKDITIDVATISESTDSFKMLLKNKGGNLFVIKKRLNAPLSYITRLSKIIKEGEYDIVHAHGNSSTLALEMLAAKLGGCKVRIAHSHNTSCKYIFLHKILKPLFNATYTTGFACSQDAGKWLFGKRHFTVINNAIKLDSFLFDIDKRNSIRNKYGIDNDVIVLGQVGSLTPRKNPLFSIEVLNCLKKGDNKKKYNLMFVGNGDLKNDIIENSRKYGLDNDIIMTGFINNVYEYLNAFDLILLPSLFEGFSIAAIEAQTNGLPIICSDTIKKDIDITGNIGFISISNAEKWAEAIVNTQLPERRKSSIKAIADIKQAGFDIEEEMIKLKEKYYALIN